MAWWTLYKRELSTYFQSTVAYIVLFGSALIQSIEFIFIVSAVASANYKDQSVMQIFFTWPLFWILPFTQIPLITMRVFSEEFKLGTIEMLMTAPVREWDVVIAKFLGALTFFLVLWVPIALDLLALQVFSNPPPPVYWSQIGLTLLTLVLFGGFYIAIGIFTSALTKNQIIAAVLCFAFIFAAFGIAFLRWIGHTAEGTLAWVSYVSTQEHLQNAGQGLFDTRPIVFYVTITAFILLLTQRTLLGRRLKG